MPLKQKTKQKPALIRRDLEESVAKEIEDLGTKLHYIAMNKGETYSDFDSVPYKVYKNKDIMVEDHSLRSIDWYDIKIWLNKSQVFQARFVLPEHEEQETDDQIYASSNEEYFEEEEKDREGLIFQEYKVKLYNKKERISEEFIDDRKVIFKKGNWTDKINKIYSNMKTKYDAQLRKHRKKINLVKKINKAKDISEIDDSEMFK